MVSSRALTRYGQGGRYLSAIARSPVAMRAAYKVGSYLGKRTADAVRSFRSKRSRTVTASSPITTQFDVSGRYRRKPVSQRKRRQWKRFSGKVKHVMLQQQALSTYTIDFINRETWAANKQVTFGVMLGGTTAPNNDELFQIFRQAYGGGITTTTVDDYKLFVKSICLDVQISNSGTNGAILDVYTLQARSSDNAAAETIGSQYIRLYAEMTGASVNSPVVDEPASTPFVNALFLQKWKIMSKKEILLGSGQVTTMQLRNPVNKTLQGKAIESNNSYLPGYTRAYLFQVRGSPRFNGTTSELGAGTVEFARQFSINYNIPPGNTRATAADA